MYKDRLGADNEAADSREVVNFKDFPMNNLQNNVPEDQENITPQEKPHTPVNVLRRSTRTIRPPQRFSPSLNYILLTDSGEPESYEEAIKTVDSTKWELAMKDEMDSLMSNKTWRLAELPKDKKCTTEQMGTQSKR